MCGTQCRVRTLQLSSGSQQEIPALRQLRVPHTCLPSLPAGKPRLPGHPTGRPPPVHTPAAVVMHPAAAARLSTLHAAAGARVYHAPCLTRLGIFIIELGLEKNYVGLRADVPSSTLLSGRLRPS